MNSFWLAFCQEQWNLQPESDKAPNSSEDIVAKWLSCDIRARDHKGGSEAGVFGTHNSLPIKKTNS